MIPLIYEVAERVDELPDAVTLSLEPETATIDPPAPGQFTMLYAFGVGEVPMSVSRIEGKRVHQTVRDVAPVSHALSELQPGEAVGMRGPFGNGWSLDVDPDTDVLVVGGGLGLAPVRPAVDALLERRSSLRRLTLLGGARRPEELLYADELSQLAGGEAIDVRVTVDQATRGWTGAVGVVTELLPDVRIDADRTRAIICGPEIMMRFSALALLDRGVPAERIEVSIERNMKCALGRCGRCQLGPLFACQDGPVVTFDRVAGLWEVPDR